MGRAARSSRPLLLATSLAACATLLASCTDGSLMTGVREPTATALRRQYAPIGAPQQLVSVLGQNNCVAISGSATQGNPAIIYPCSGGDNQQFTFQSTGELTLAGGTVCLDVWGGQANDGDPVGAWTCNGGANQKWQLTAAGEIVGQNGKCLDVTRWDTSPGVALTVYSCVGHANQRWTLRAVAAAGPSAVFSLMGSSPSVAAVEGLGGAFARYEQDFRSGADYHWNLYGPQWEFTNYYDRAMIYYVWWARSGNATYRARADSQAVNYRDQYLAANAYQSSDYWAQLDGVALHYAVTGDTMSRLAVGRVADRFATSGYQYAIRTTSSSDGSGRTQARVLTAFTLAARLQAPSADGHDWRIRARDAVDAILSTQDADGAYRWNSHCYLVKPFMDGMVNDALIQYYALIDADSRIPGAVQRNVDYLWANAWDPATQSFTYLTGTCGGESGGPAPDLNNMIASGFGFVYQRTQDPVYRTRGDAVFASGVYGAQIQGQKQFNQAYTTSYRYLSFR